MKMISKLAAMGCVQAVVLTLLTLQVSIVESSNLRKWDPATNYMDHATNHEIIAGKRHDMGIEKGHLLADVYTECEMKYKEAKRIANEVSVKAGEKIRVSKRDEEALEGSIASATAAESAKDPATGESQKMKWMDKLENEQGEQVFYKRIVDNAKLVRKDVDTGTVDTAELRKNIHKEFAKLEKLQTPYEVQAEHARFVLEEAKKLWQQWLDSSKDYSCGPPPAVDNAQSMCKDGNTNYSPKCTVTCLPGFDDPQDSKNSLRCRKQGEFGKQLYGEWKGIASCVGRMCGKPQQIEKAKTVIQDIRFPHLATYNCYEGYSQDAKPKGAKAFSVPCGTTGSFELNYTHVCRRVLCGNALPIMGTQAVAGLFYFGDTADYRCKPGQTLDETPGGLKNFTTSCQATGRFTQGHNCRRVRCGPAPEYGQTDLLSTKGEKYYDDELEYECRPGYSTDQRPSGPKKFTLRCDGDGEFSQKGGAGSAPVPQCRPVSAGMLPAVEHGNAKRREMFFGESVVIAGDTGYSTTGKPTEGLSFIVDVTPQGTFAGLQQFIPVSCGPPPSVEKAVTAFSSSEGVYGNVLSYKCEDGYSTDRHDTEASKSFAIQCEADADYSRVPGLKYCANIDDCADHTCGPHGDCIDHLLNYTCDCENGYAQTWHVESGELICGNIDDCGPQACGVGTCKDLLEGYSCICPTGFEEVEVDDDKTCAPRICGIPPKVENAATSPIGLANEKASYQDKVLYQCDMGYTLDATPTGKNHFSIDCLANEDFTATQSCKPIKCGGAPNVQFAAVRPATATFNQTLRYTCEDGYTIDGTADGDGSFAITCLNTGEYSQTSKCRPVNCGEPDEVPSSSRPDGSLEYKQLVTYTCFDGFTLDGNKAGPTQFQVKCHADGSLDKVKSCLPKVCGVPGTYINALYATTSDEGAVAYPRVTEVSCRDGYTVDGSASGNTSFNVACLATGLFDEYNKLQCQPVRCGRLLVMPNATLERVSKPETPAEAELSLLAKAPSLEKVLNFEEKAFYKCNPGFSTGGEPGAPKVFRVECLPTGEFSAPALDMQCRNINDCERHTCGPKGLCVDLIGTSPAYTCECDFGFEIQTDANGEKNCGNTDDCKDQDCGVGTCKDLIGDYTCICPSGHYIAEKNGGKTCVPRRCAADTPSLDNGRLLSEHSGPVDFPATLQYQCDQGYSIDGTVPSSKRRFQAQCKPNGELDGMMSCQKISCGTPRVLPFANLVAPWTPRKSVEFGEIVEYACAHGYTIGGHAEFDTEFTVSCPDNGVLTDPQVCEPVKCGRAPTLPKCRAAISGDVFFGMHLEYNCDTGYTLNGQSGGPTEFQRFCTQRGSFSDLASDQPCKPIRGGEAPVIRNAVMTEYAGRPVGAEDFPPLIYYPDGLEYTCNAGYSENGSPSGPTKMTSRVNTLGHLSPALPTECKAITYVVSGQVKDARDGSSLSGATVQVSGVNGHYVTSSGRFTLTGVRPGNVTIVYRREGFIEATRSFTVNCNINGGGVADAALSPVMRTDEWRAVVEWDRLPADLDTHAWWANSEVKWSRKYRSVAGLSIQLEHDVTSGHGPETLHFSGVGSCMKSPTYCNVVYTIKDYDRTSRMADISKAVVKLYHGRGLEGTYALKDCQSSVKANGNEWDVFILDGKTNEVKWNCPMGPPPSGSTLLYYDASHQAKPEQQKHLNKTVPPSSLNSDLKLPTVFEELQHPRVNLRSSVKGHV